jgi:hypothetical protein
MRLLSIRIGMLTSKPDLKYRSSWRNLFRISHLSGHGSSRIQGRNLQATTHLFQKRDILCGWWMRTRLQECIDVGQFLV